MGHRTISERLEGRHDITHLDIVVANAGATSGFKHILDTEADDLKYDFRPTASDP